MSRPYCLDTGRYYKDWCTDKLDSHDCHDNSRFQVYNLALYIQMVHTADHQLVSMVVVVESVVALVEHLVTGNDMAVVDRASLSTTTLKDNSDIADIVAVVHTDLLMERRHKIVYNVRNHGNDFCFLGIHHTQMANRYVIQDHKTTWPVYPGTNPILLVVCKLFLAHPRPQWGHHRFLALNGTHLRIHLLF